MQRQWQQIGQHQNRSLCGRCTCRSSEAEGQAGDGDGCAAGRGGGGDEEHLLIAAYASELRSRQPDGAAATAAAVAATVETLERELEMESVKLQAEFDRLMSGCQAGAQASCVTSSTNGWATAEAAAAAAAEARLLRVQRDRLEQRMAVLEEQNRRLETQLTRLRRLLTPPAVSAPATPRRPESRGGVVIVGAGQVGRSSVGSLLAMAGRVSSAMGQLVEAVNAGDVGSH